MGKGPRILIIGGVAAGTKTAARARRLSSDADITIIERGKLISYAGCGMPFYLAGQVKDFNLLFSTTYGVKRDEEYFSSERGVRVLTLVEAQKIDRERKEVLVEELTTGDKFTMPYDKLVLAVGSEPFVPPIEGRHLKGVYRMNHPDDLQNVMGEINDMSEAVVIGAGLIGMEVASALVERKKFVTVVELQKQILPGVLDTELSDVLKTRLEEQGMEFRLGEGVLRLEGGEDGRVCRVVTDSGPIDTEMVIIAVGVRPNVKLAKEAGLTIGETGAIAVNQYLQTSDPDIYAAGDCVENTHLVSGKKVYIPLASTANRQGRVVGDNVAGRRSRFKGVLGTAILKVLNWNIARTGLNASQAREAGFDVLASMTAGFDRTHYHPDHGLIITKLIVDRGSRRILGVQAIGPGDVAKRIDVVSAVINFSGTIDDLAEVDLAYAPPYNTPIDPLHHAANTVRNRLEGLAEGICAHEVMKKMERGEDFVLLDVRTPHQFGIRHIEDDRTMLVALGELRKRIEEIPRDKEIIIVCGQGMRSYEAVRTLVGAGFENVSYLECGLEGWPYELD